MGNTNTTTTTNNEEQEHQSVVDASSSSIPSLDSSFSSISISEAQQAQHQQEFPDEIMNHQVPCETKKGDLIPVRLSLLLQSKLFSDMFKDLCFSMDEEELTVKMLVGFKFPVQEISTEIFKRVVKWMEEHDGKPELKIKVNPLTGDRIWFKLSDFEKQFFDVNADELASLIMAAHFLDLNSMYLLGTQSMAAIFRDKPAEFVRDYLGLDGDVSEEEKEAIRRRNVWAMY